jgi:hypothetical protein
VSPPKRGIRGDDIGRVMILGGYMNTLCQLLRLKTELDCLTDQFAMLLSMCINLRASAGAALF